MVVPLKANELVVKAGDSTYYIGEESIAGLAFNYNRQESDLSFLSGNDLNELVYARLPGKENLSVSIPVFETGIYTITMVSDAFLAKSNSLKIMKISPA